MHVRAVQWRSNCTLLSVPHCTFVATNNARTVRRTSQPACPHQHHYAHSTLARSCNEASPALSRTARRSRDVARSYSRCCRKVSPRDVAARAASRFAALSLDPGRPDGTAEPSWSILTEHTWPRAAGAVCAYVLRRARAHATSISGGLAGWWRLVLDKVAVFRLRLCWVAVEPLVFLGYMVANPCDL